MICPACKTNNTNHHAECCVQCGADIQVHRLIQMVREEIHMKNDPVKPTQEAPKKASSLFIAAHIIPSVLLLVCAVFGIFVGMRFLAYIDRLDSHRVSISDKWSETGFEQLQQMNTTIKQALDLILDQRRENQVLQAKIEQLTAPDAPLAAPVPVPTPAAPIIQEVTP
ncbi:MAG TPA: hypothetical protein DDY37_05285 [Legionella sp.]|nr:hypothetical protein [Legionella sp.]